MKRKFSSWFDRLLPRERLNRELATSRERLYRLAFSWSHDQALAEDLVHDTIAAALDRIHQLRDASRLDIWLTKIMLNLYRDHARRTRPETGWDQDMLSTTGDLPVDELMTAEIVVQTRCAISQLSVDHRQVISLDEIERLLSSYAQEQRPVRVEIVSHGEGLALLRDSISTHKGRVHALASTFQNLTFVACLNTMDRLRVEQGIEVNLVPDAEVTRSGVSHVVKRQREGWAYIRV